MDTSNGGESDFSFDSSNDGESNSSFEPSNSGESNFSYDSSNGGDSSSDSQPDSSFDVEANENDGSYDSSMDDTVQTTVAPKKPRSCVDIQVDTKSWAFEISWVIKSDTPGKDCQGKGYTDNSHYDTRCCLEPGKYELECKDSYGDGWNGAFLTLNGKKYCDEFGSGKSMKTHVQIGTSKKVKKECFDVDMTLTTGTYAYEVSWEFGDCKSTESYTNNKEYDIKCCLPVGQSYVLKCKDAYGDGWNGAYMTVNGQQFCKDFQTGSLQSESVFLEAIEVASKTPTHIDISTLLLVSFIVLSAGLYFFLFRPKKLDENYALLHDHEI